MSSKIPVGATVNEAFRFGMKRWPSVLRFFWLPIALGGGTIALLVGGLIDFKAAQAIGAPTNSFAAFQSVLRVPAPVFFAAVAAAYAAVFLLMSGGVASIFRLVVHGEERRGIFQLRFDGPAIRVFFSYVVLMLINLAVFGAALLVASLVTGQSPFGGFAAIMQFFQEAAKADAAGASSMPTESVQRLMDEARPLMTAWAFSVLPLVYLGVKLAAFPAGSAAEDRLLLFGTFRMTFGHWWSIFFCFVLTFIALVLLAIVVEIPFNILVGLGKALAQQGGAAAAIGGLIVFLSTAAYLVYQFFVVAVQLALNAVIYRRLAYGE